MVEVDGRFAVYFNRHQAAPLVWCIALISGVDVVWEISVPSLVISGVVVSTKYAPPEGPDDETGLPSAIMVCSGLLSVNSSGHATITGLPR